MRFLLSGVPLYCGATPADNRRGVKEVGNAGVVDGVNTSEFPTQLESPMLKMQQLESPMLKMQAPRLVLSLLQV